MMQKLRWFVLLVGVIVLLSAMYQNATPDTVKLFYFETTMPKYVLLFVTAALGFLLGAITTNRMLKRSPKPKATAAKPGKLKPGQSKPGEPLAMVTPDRKTTPF